MKRKTERIIEKSLEVYTDIMSVIMVLAILLFFSYFLLKNPTPSLLILSIILSAILGFFIFYIAWRLSQEQ